MPTPVRVHRALLALIPMALFACKEAGPPHPEAYPDAPRMDHTDDYFGTPVADPYRWMEDLENPEVTRWVEAQNAIALPFLEGIPGRSEVKDRLTDLWDYERFGVPWKEGGLYFFTRNDGLQDQDVVYFTESLASEPRILLDPNELSEDATVALAGLSVSPDGRYVAYATSDGGTDWNTWHVREISSGEDLPDEVAYTKFTSASWLPNGSGFFYSRYPQGPGGEGDGQAQVSIRFHSAGTSQEADELVYEVEDSDTRNPYGTVTEDGRYLVIEVTEGYDSNAVYYRDLGAPSGRVERLLDGWDALYHFVGNDGPVFFFHTNKDAPRNRVVAIDIQAPASWQEIVSQAEETLEAASFVGGHFVGRYLKDASSLVRIFTRDGLRSSLVQLGRSSNSRLLFFRDYVEWFSTIPYAARVNQRYGTIYGITPRGRAGIRRAMVARLREMLLPSPTDNQ